MNSIFIIAPYRYEGSWVFDDARVGLVREPFVSGADTLIDMMVAEILDAERGFRLIFSAGPFPGFMARICHQREEMGGHWYRWDEKNAEGWLCPALFKYFATAPDDIYARAENKQ